MKHTGMTRSLDELGRIVLPKEIRESFNLNYKDALEIFVEDEKIILRKYQPGDVFDGDMENLVDYKGKKVSLESIKALVELAKDSGYEL
nr:AbrB/MazE/SpoVT family DNA-binding domain-containing protein [uncultured Tyzzerella sp.]